MNTSFCEALVYPFYRQPQRQYHTVEHIKAIMDSVGKHKIELTIAQQLAIWYHDSVYMPGSSTNEADSARLMAYVLKQYEQIIPQINRLGMIEAIPTACEIIVDTAHHHPSSDGAAIVLDLDMEILAASADRYEEYLKEIRFEYALFSDEDFAEGRKKFLKSLIGLERIFSTDRFHKEYDLSARLNIERELMSF